MTKVAEAWECHAQPAPAGKPCGHFNVHGGITGGPHRLRCCEKCGCTKIASDDRARRKAEHGTAK